MKSRKSGLWTVDVARGAGYSVQQVRILERDGVLPPVERTASGYRIYAEAHVQAAIAYREFAAGLGPVDAKQLMRTALNRPTVELLASLDAAHADLHVARQRLRLAKKAAESITAEPLDDVRPSDVMSIGELAEALGVRASTLRHWEDEGLVAPDRTVGRRARSYSPAAVRDARIAHQLRLAGYRIDVLRALIPQLSTARDHDGVLKGLNARDSRLDERSRALLHGTAALVAMNLV